uniref:Uncharacterized protein n=1 Tax=Cucumis melo TaxID=3656 RepID=A0A9I9DQM3_CUCME
MSGKNVGRGIPDAASCVGIRSFERETPDATLVDACHSVGRGISDALLVRRRECLFRLISLDVVPEVVKNVGISFPNVFVRQEYPCLLQCLELLPMFCKYISRRRECLFRLISPDVVPEVVKNVGISFPNVFVRREYPCLLQCLELLPMFCKYISKGYLHLNHFHAKHEWREDLGGEG